MGQQPELSRKEGSFGVDKLEGVVCSNVEHLSQCTLASQYDLFNSMGFGPIMCLTLCVHAQALPPWNTYLP